MFKSNIHTLTAFLVLAITFTLSCSGSDDPDNGGDPGGGGVINGTDGIAIPKDSQVYNEDGSKYTSSGDIEARFYHILSAGSVTNGVVKLELPPTIPNEYLKNFPDQWTEENCPNYPKDVKVYWGLFVLTNSNEDYIGDLRIVAGSNKEYFEGIVHFYFSKAAKISCDCNTEGCATDIDAKAGWTTIFMTGTKWTTKNILTKEVKWTLQSDH
jgi:hypothetical protein